MEFENPLAKFIMPTAAQQAAQQPPQSEDKTQMIIDALRQGQGGMGGGGAPVSSGRVQSAGYMGQGMNTNAIGTALGSMFKPSGYGDVAGAAAGVPQF